MRAIIPCAGFGTRMNMPKNKSKELMLYRGRPIIEYTLEICSIYKLKPLVITRGEKTDLIKYCDKNDIDCLEIKPEGEWADTVIKSQMFWREHNVLMLPDTVWSPISAIEQIKFNLQMGVGLCFGMHSVDDVSKWGSINDQYLYEKRNQTSPGYAWGVIGFTQSHGRRLFKHLANSTWPFCIDRAAYVKLDSFKDVTRGE